MTTPDAYLVDDGMDSWFSEDADHEGCDVTALELVASFDHGLRTADETSWCVGTECVAQVCRAFYVACGIPWCNGWAIGGVHSVDWYAAGKEADVPFPDNGTWCDKADDSQALYEWCDYEAEPMFWHAGGIVETNADSGMTWLYVPMAQD